MMYIKSTGSTFGDIGLQQFPNVFCHATEQCEDGFERLPPDREASAVIDNNLMHKPVRIPFAFRAGGLLHYPIYGAL